MSFVIAAPEVIAAAATDLASLGSSISAANAAAAANTTALMAAGADEVSTAIAALFGAHGQAYQALSAQAQAFHAQFVQALTSGGGAYAAAEAAAVSPLLDPINEFFLANTGRPLIGNGANGAPGTGANGGDGGWTSGGGAYAAAEAAAVSPLLDPINEFFLANTGRPVGCRCGGDGGLSRWGIGGGGGVGAMAAGGAGLVGLAR